MAKTLTSVLTDETSPVEEAWKPIKGYIDRTFSTLEEALEKRNDIIDEINNAE